MGSKYDLSSSPEKVADRGPGLAIARLKQNCKRWHQALAMIPASSCSYLRCVPPKVNVALICMPLLEHHSEANCPLALPTNPRHAFAPFLTACGPPIKCTLNSSSCTAVSSWSSSCLRRNSANAATPLRRPRHHGWHLHRRLRWAK